MITFVNNRICPYGHRAWLTLLELGVPFEEKKCTIKAGQKEPWFTEIYQKALGANEGSDGKVPVIDDDGFILTESAVIAEYLASKYGPSVGKELITVSPQEKAFATIFLEQHAQQYTKFFYALLKEQDPDRAKSLTGELLKAVKKISDVLKVHKGPYLLGEKFTLTDILFYPFVERLSVLKHFREFTVPDEEDYQPFHCFCQAMEARPAVQAAKVDISEFLDAYRAYAEGKL
jgi:glutathione S-transferase